MKIREQISEYRDTYLFSNATCVSSHTLYLHAGKLYATSVHIATNPRQMDLDWVPNTWPCGTQPLAPIDEPSAVAEVETLPAKRARFTENSCGGTDVHELSIHSLFSDFGEEEDDDPFAALDLGDLLPPPAEPSWIELQLKQRLAGFLAQHLPHLVSLDVTPQIRRAVEACFGETVPVCAQPLSPAMNRKLNMTAAVLALIYGLGNKRDVLFIHPKTNRSSQVVSTEAQLEKSLRRNPIEGVVVVQRHFKVDKRSLCRSLKWALGCPSCGSSSKETFLCHKKHMNFAKAKQKLLYFGDQV